MSTAIRKAWQKPELRARYSLAKSKALQKPEYRARMSAAARKRVQDPAWRAQQSRIARMQWAQDHKRMARNNRQISRRVAFGAFILRANKASKQERKNYELCYAIGKAVDERLASTWPLGNSNQQRSK
jgi:hypothetical protein